MKRYSNILLVVDSGSDQRAALQRSVTLANNTQAALTVCAVVEEIPADVQVPGTAVTAAELNGAGIAEEHARLERLVGTSDTAGMAVTVKVRVGKLFLEVIREVLECRHDIVIKTAEDKVGVSRMLFGSTDMHLMRKCPSPIWIVNAGEHSKCRRILVAVDQDPDDFLNRQIIETAVYVALAEFSELHFVHAWELIGESHMRSPRTGLSDSEVDAIAATESNKRLSWLKQLVENYSNEVGKGATAYLNPQLHVVKGDPKSAIATLARDLDADLVVMGTLARSGIPGFFMGNTAESILSRVECSALTIKPPGFVSPVSV